MTNEDAVTNDEVGLAARVRRLEAAVASLEARLAAAPARAASPTDPGDAPIPSAPAVRVAAPSAPAPKSDAGGLEARLATYWLSRLGVVALVTGIAWFIALHFGDMSPVARVALGYGIAAGLGGLGAWLARTHRVLGHVVVGGGLAVAYSVTYALHFIASVRLIDDPLSASILLAFVVASIVAIGQRLRSETIVGIALFLGFHTSLVGEIRAFTLVSIAILAAAAAYTFVTNRWILVPLTSMAAVYATHGAATAWEPASTDGDAWLTVAFLVVDFVVFAIAALSRPGGEPRRRVELVALAIGNALGFVGFGALACDAHAGSRLGPFLGLASFLLLVTAAGAHRRGSRLLVEIHLAVAVPIIGWTVVEALPWPVAAVVVAVLGAGAMRVAAWARLVNVPPAVLATLLLVLGGLAAESPSSIVAPVALGASLVHCGWAPGYPRESTLALRWLAAAAGAAAWLLAVHAMVGWSSATLGWVVVSLVLVAIGMVLRDRPLRLTGLGVLGMASCKLLLVDLARLPTDQRILTFVASGAILIGLSYAYARFRRRLERYL